MGRLPGGIVDDFRDKIIQQMDVEKKRQDQKKKISLNLSLANQKTDGTPLSNSAPRTPNNLQRLSLGGGSGNVGQGQQRQLPAVPVLDALGQTPLGQHDRPSARNSNPSMPSGRQRGIWNPSNFMRYPLRPMRDLAPRNFVTNLPPKGHYASTPGTTIGMLKPGVVGEYTYKIEGPDPDRALLPGPNPPFRPSHPAKKLNGSGSHEGLFSHNEYVELGPGKRQKTWEATGSRMIAQHLYPLQILPTVVAPS